jgi:nucleoside-diphosphate-sugar epimerase
MQVERIREPILVTGASGFIGKRLCARLVQGGHRPRALVLDGEVPPKEWDERIEVRRGDVTRRGSVADAIEGAATVFHLAAVVGDWGAEEAFERVTIRGTEHVLGEAARVGARAILASSVVYYGDDIPRAVLDEDRPPGKPLGLYSRAKQAQEAIARRLEGSAGLKLVIVRPTNVYGPGSGPWVDTLVDLLRAGQPVLVDGGRGDAGLTYVDNVVDVMVRAAERPAAVGRAYNASDENGVTWLEYASRIARICGAPAPKSLNGRVAMMAAGGIEATWRILKKTSRPLVTREALNLTRGMRAPITRARRELGYEPRVSFDDGMAAVTRYLDERGTSLGGGA